MRLLFLAILCIQGVFLYAEKPTHLKALVVFDASGSKLQKYYRLDGARMKKNLLGIASQTGLIPEIHLFKAHQLTQQKINSWIATLSAKDVAVFYYAGKESYVRKRKWPSLTISRGKKEPPLTQEGLTKTIQQKKPHLTLVLVDCYSKVIRIPRKRYTIKDTIPLQRTAKDPGLVSLFRESSGVITACSTRRGKPGFAVYQNRPIGGLLTTTVQNYLYARCGTGMPYWADMLSKLRTDSLYLSRNRQIPFMRKTVLNPSLVPPVPKSDATRSNARECQ